MNEIFGNLRLIHLQRIVLERRGAKEGIHLTEIIQEGGFAFLPLAAIKQKCAGRQNCEGKIMNGAFQFLLR